MSIFWLAKSKLDKALNRGNGLGARGVWISTGKTAEGDVCWRDKGNTSQLCVYVHGCACNVCVYTMICAAAGAWLLPRGLSCPDATSSPAAGGIYTENVEIDISVCAYIYIFLPADFHTAQQEQGARRDTGAVCIGVNTLGICGSVWPAVYMYIYMFYTHALHVFAGWEHVLSPTTGWACGHGDVADLPLSDPAPFPPTSCSWESIICTLKWNLIIW